MFQVTTKLPSDSIMISADSSYMKYIWIDSHINHTISNKETEHTSKQRAYILWSENYSLGPFT